MHTEAISYDVRGVTYVGYLAAPVGSDVRRPGVLVGHTWQIARTRLRAG